MPAPASSSLAPAPSPLPLDAARQRLVDRNAQTLAWQASVTRIAAPTGQEGARARWLATEFQRIGWTDVVIDRIGNLFARRPGPRPAGAPVWCCAHLDTVFPDTGPVPVTSEGTRLRGPGICDNGRGLAALLALADALAATGIPTAHEVVMVATVGEEGLGDLRGIRHALDHAAVAPRAVIAIDGSGDDRIVHCAIGASRWRITLSGPGGHSWADYGTVNPVAAAASIAHVLTGLPLPREPRTTLTIARLTGGESINSIPGSAVLELDIRSLGVQPLREAERAMRQAVRDAERRELARRTLGSEPLSVQVEQIGDRPCGILPPATPLVRLAERVTTSLGLVPRLASGSTDASVPISRGIPAIAIGAGGVGGGMHTRDEWYDDVDGVRGLERALLIAASA